MMQTMFMKSNYYNSAKKRKILIVFDDMTANVLGTKL